MDAVRKNMKLCAERKELIEKPDPKTKVIKFLSSIE